MLEVNSLLLACLDWGVKEGDLVYVLDLCQIQTKVATKLAMAMQITCAVPFVGLRAR